MSRSYGMAKKGRPENDPEQKMTDFHTKDRRFLKNPQNMFQPPFPPTFEFLN